MHLLVFNAAVCAIALVYCIYRQHSRLEQKKQRQVRQRIAFLLWMVAAKARPSEADLSRG